jgi:hypothetical protein
MTFSDRMKRLFTLMRDGQLIVSGGGLTVRQLPSGEYQISLQGSDLAGNNDRYPGGGWDDSSNGSTPGKPQKPNTYPPLITPPPPPAAPPDTSGSYSGPSSTGNKTKGSGVKSDPYDFNQRGWEYYIENF